MEAIEETCCVVTISPLRSCFGSQIKAMSCGAVFINYQPGIAACTGVAFSGYIRDKHNAENDSKTPACSGVLVNPDVVLTCRHVVNEKSVLTVRINIGSRLHAVSGKVLYPSAPSSPYDVAVMGLQESPIHLVNPRFAKHFHPGEDVVVVGYGALGASCGPSVTSGILSCVITHKSQPVMLQTTCAVQAGASGGAVVRPGSGELLGIVTSNTRDFTAKVTYPHLNFSVPVTVLEPLLELFAQTGNAAVFKVLDAAENDVRHVWRLLQSKL